MHSVNGGVLMGAQGCGRGCAGTLCVCGVGCWGASSVGMGGRGVRGSYCGECVEGCVGSSQCV